MTLTDRLFYIRDLKEVWKEFLTRRAWSLAWYEYQSIHHYMLHYEQPQDLREEPNVFEFIASHLYGMLLCIRCSLTDHQWVDCSSAGPDSGDMDMYCKRCGYNFHHQLY